MKEFKSIFAEEGAMFNATPQQLATEYKAVKEADIHGFRSNVDRYAYANVVHAIGMYLYGELFTDELGEVS